MVTAFPPQSDEQQNTDQGSTPQGDRNNRKSGVIISDIIPVLTIGIVVAISGSGSIGMVVAISGSGSIGIISV